MRTAHVPPHSLEAEMSTLGSMMLDQHAIEKVAEILRPDDFYRDAHRILYEVILSLAERHIPVDLLTVQEELKRRDQLEEVGGLAALAQIVESVPSASNAEYYARIVEEKAILRRLIRAAHDILQLTEDTDLELQEIIDRAEHAVFGVAQRRLGRYFTPIDRLLIQVLEHIEQVQLSGRGILGVPTHFPDLDYKTSGLQPSELIILAARPSVGKTSLALNIAENVALRENRPVAIFSLEMSREQLVQRMLCSQAGVSGSRIRRGNLTNEDWERLQLAAERLFRAPIYIDDTSSLSVLEMRAKCRRLKAERNDLALIVVDYLQLMRSHTRRAENRNQEIGEIARALKSLAREFEAPVLVLSQLSRAVERREEKRPILSDLRDSGSIEAEADVVMFLHRPHRIEGEFEDEPREAGVVRTEEVELIIAKQRNGPTDRVPLGFQPALFRFVTLERAVSIGE
ncbi:Replicative DNA helicase [bacterium HR15]|nr:Replicative DNA helicase [bacterium HR15]